MSKTTNKQTDAKRDGIAEDHDEQLLEFADDIKHFFQQALVRWKKYDSCLHFKEGLKFKAIPIIVWELMRSARSSFLFGLDAGAIISISAAVELALYQVITEQIVIKKIPCRGLKHAIEEAYKKGCDVEALLAPLEAQSLQGGQFSKISVQFVTRRNAIAHGTGVFGTATAFMLSTPQEKEAFDQLSKGQEFLQSWATTFAPKLLQSRLLEDSREVIPVAGTGLGLAVGFYNAWDPARRLKKANKGRSRG